MHQMQLRDRDHPTAHPEEDTMTMYSHEATYREEDEYRASPPDDWSTESYSPEPSAPSESDLLMYLASDEEHNSSTGMMEQDEPRLTIYDSDFPPALPVAVMEPTQAPSSPVAFYDYQRDRVVYSPNTAIVAEANNDGDFECEYEIRSSSEQSEDWVRGSTRIEEATAFASGVADAVVGTLVLGGAAPQRDFRYRRESSGQSSENNMVQRDTRTVESTAVVSGVAGAVVGTLVLGAVPGLIAGFYASYAHGQDGAAGDISRALGEIALVARDKAIAIDSKHKLVARGKMILAEAWEHAKLLDRQHRILKRIKDFAKFSFAMTLQFIHRSSLLDNNKKPTRASPCNVSSRPPRPVPVSNSLEQRQPLACRSDRRGSYQQAGAVPLNVRPAQARSY